MALNMEMPKNTGGTAEPQSSKDNAQLVVGLHGSHYDAASRGRAFFGSTAAGGVALLVPASGGSHPTLWNPSGSGVNLSIIRLELGYVSGNNAPGAIEWARTLNAGVSHATGGSVVTATKVTPEPCLIGTLADSKAIWSPTTNSFLSAPVFLRSAGMALLTGVAATATVPFTLRADYEGDFVLAPDVAVSLCFQTTTTTAVFQVTVTWEEIPV